MIGNRVLNRMALVPMADWVLCFVLSQTVAYVLLYSSMLGYRTKIGKVTQPMLDFAKTRFRTFFAIGFFEALYLMLMFSSSSKLPGAVLPVFAQSMLLWNLFFSAIILRKRFKKRQLLGAVLVAGGAATVAARRAGSATVIDPFYAAMFICAHALPSLTTIFKERMFGEARADLGGKELDVFVINTCGSLSQALWTLAFLPLTTAQRGIQLGELPAYMASGLGKLIGLDSGTTGLVALLPIVYVFWNVLFNITIVSALRVVGAVAMNITVTAAIPATIWVFTMDLPLLGSSQLGPTFWQGTAILIAGMLLFYAPDKLFPGSARQPELA